MKSADPSGLSGLCPCGKTIPPNRKFCGRACAAKGMGLGNRDKRPSNYKGGTITAAGYRAVAVPFDHIYAVMACRQGKALYILEHRLVMATHLGRALSSDEVVHHINGNKDDNHLDNLELTTQAEHAREHALNREKPTHCPMGHPYGVQIGKRRRCRICHNERCRKNYQRGKHARP